MTTSPIIVAFDVHTLDEVSALADQLDPANCRVKVGKELFTRFGPTVVELLQKRGFELFLDLKFHDIPNTVAAAVKVAADLGVWMVNVHAGGGARMMTAAADALSSFRQPPKLIAVTVLTSMLREDLLAVGVESETVEQVQRLAGLTKECGLSGVVCSAQETTFLRRQMGEDFLLVTPGIRPAGASADDQRRIATPAQAMSDGSSYLVIGRPITQGADPAAILAQINESLG